MEINYLNLKKMFNHILENVPEDMINIKQYRRHDDHFNHECKSIGCIIGHCIILDDWLKVPKLQDESIDFIEWSQNFTGFMYYDDNWLWCFSGNWYNNREQALLRLKYFIDNKSVPNDWKNFQYCLPTKELLSYEIN